MPSLGGWLRTVREHRNLTRPQVEADAHISAAHLKLVETGSTIPRQSTLDKIVTVYGMSGVQQRHTTELYQPSLPLPPVDELRQRVLHGHRAELSAFESRSLACGFCDPLWNVLASNQTFDVLYPGLGNAENNLALLHLHTMADDPATPSPADADTVFLVASLRGAFGRFRDEPRATRLLHRLCEDHRFRTLWTTSVAVAYERGPHRLRSPGLDATVTAQVTELRDEPGVLSIVAYRRPHTTPARAPGLDSPAPDRTG